MRTHPLGPSILPGITRHVLLDLASTFDTGVGEAHKHRRTRCTQQNRSLPARPSSSFPWSALAAGRLEMGRPGSMAKLLQASYIERACNSRDRPALRNSICATDWKRLAEAHCGCRFPPTAGRRICVSEQPASSLRSIQLQPIIYFGARTKDSTSLVRAFAASSGGSFSVTT